MKLKDKLKNIDSQDVEREFPADWDMDKVFDSSYRKYLFMKNNPGMKAPESNFRICSAEKVSHESRIRHVITNTVPIAACFAVIWGMSKLVSLTPVPVEYESKPDESDTVPPYSEESSVSAEQNNIFTELPESIYKNTENEPDFSENTEPPSMQDTKRESENAHSPIMTDDNSASPAKTDAPTTTVPDIITSPVVTTLDKATDEPQDVTAKTDETEEASAPPPIMTTAEDPPNFEPEPPGEAPEAPGREPVPEIPVPPEKPSESSGQSKPSVEMGFIQHDPDYSSIYPYITFNPPNAAAEPKEHSVMYDGFTTELSSDAYNVTIYKVTDDSTEQTYVISINKKYEWFVFSYSTDYEYELSFFEINSRPAMYHYSGKTKLGMLAFDDGCHIVTIVSEHKDYDTMLYLAENFN